MKAKAMPEGTKTLEDERKENLDALDRPEGGEEGRFVRPVELTIRKTFKDGALQLENEYVEDELIQVSPFLVEPAEVGCSRGITINMGNFESARVDVSVKVPCYREELDEAYEFAARFTEERLMNERDKVIGGRAKKSRERAKEDLF